MASQITETAPASEAPANTTAPTTAQAPVHPHEAEGPLPEDGNIEADDDELDSAIGSSDGTESTSIASNILRGYVEHGRKYSVLAERQYHQPADEKQMESWNAGHHVLLVLDSWRDNNLFYAPLDKKAQRILDIGTGDGSWAIDVADKFPDKTVHAVDLYPPPHRFVPPNCIFELDDVSKPWTWKHRFDLIHMRWMLGSFTTSQWRDLYAQAYDRLQPGGWIEHVEPSVICRSDDGTLPPDSLLANWGQRFERMGTKSGRPFNIFDTMKASIDAAGFTNIREKIYKVPFGTWAKHPVHKDAGRLNEIQFREGMEGYALYMFTHIGDPEPIAPEAVQMYLAAIRKELEERKWHKYIFNRRVWAQKPLDSETKKATEPVVESVE